MWKKIILLTALLACLLAAQAIMPRTVTLSQTEITWDLAEGSTFDLTAVIGPEGAEGKLKWWVTDTHVLSVEDGLVTARKTGKADVRVAVHGYPDASSRCTVTVIDSRIPQRLIVYPSVIMLEPSRSVRLECLAIPQEAGQEVIYVSGNPGIATVDENGLVTALACGNTSVTVKSAYSGEIFRSVRISVNYGERITGLELAQGTLTLEAGQSRTLNVKVTPENASRAYIFETSDEDVARADENGVISALRYGRTVITVRSYRDKDICASVTVDVTDADRPDRIECDLPASLLLFKGESREFSAKAYPDTAHGEYTVISSRPDIVSVSGNRLTALKRGFSVITLTSVYDPEVCCAYTVSVDDGTVAVELPLRRTDKAGIDKNLVRIDKLKQSALNALNGLTGAEYDCRANVIEKAFEMYAFPWTVEAVQKYWEAANSENGAKDFKPGTVYYGLPYTSGTNHNRTYNVSRALEQQRYVPSEDGTYYVLNTLSEDYAMGYAGNDCSAYVALALWGYTMHDGDTVKTGTLYYDSRLRAFDDPAELKPGDILVRHSSHVVMFLYWVDEDHTQAMIIQQGGSEPAINTVNAVLEEITYYTEDSYRLRRLAEY